MCFMNVILSLQCWVHSLLQAKWSKQNQGGRPPSSVGSTPSGAAWCGGVKISWLSALMGGPASIAKVWTDRHFEKQNSWNLLQHNMLNFTFANYTTCIFWIRQRGHCAKVKIEAGDKSGDLWSEGRRCRKVHVRGRWKYSRTYTSCGLR